MAARPFGGAAENSVLRAPFIAVTPAADPRMAA